MVMLLTLIAFVAVFGLGCSMNHVFVWTVNDIFGLALLVIVALCVAGIKILDWLIGRRERA